MRKYAFAAFLIVSFLFCAISHAQRYTAFSLKKAKQILISFKSKRKLPPELYYIGKINDIKGFVYDRKRKDFIIIGVNNPDYPLITLNELCVALKAVFIYGRYPYVMLTPSKKKCFVDVYMEEEIKNTSIGKELLDVALSIQQIFKEKKMSHILILSAVSEVEKAKDAGFINGFELRVISEDQKAKILNKKDGIFLRLKAISQLIALFQALEQMHINKPEELWFWLKEYKISSLKTPDRISSLSSLSCGIKVLGAAFFTKEKEKTIKILKKKVLKKRPKDKVSWSFEVEIEEKDKYFANEKEKKAIELISKAVMLTDLEKSYYEALDIYEDITKMFPKWWLAYYLMGCVRNELGHYQDAIKDYEKAIKLNSDYPMAYINKAYSYNYLGMHKKAIKELNKALKLSPYHIDAYNNRGIAFCGIGKYEKGISDFKNAIKIVPTFSIAYVNLSKAYFCLGKYKKAIKELNKALKISPLFAEAYCTRGIAHRYLGEYKKAIQDFDKAIQIKPYYAYAYLQRGLTYEDLCNWKKADKDIAEAVKLDPKIFSLYIMSAIKLKPKTAIEYHERGHAYFCIGQWKKAIKDFDKAISMRPDFASAYFYRGLSYDNLKEYKKAIQDYSKAIELFPEDAVMYNNRGTAYYNCKEYKKALMDFNKAIKLDPKRAVFYENRVRLFWHLGRNKEACEDAKHACELGRCRLLRLLSEKGICR